MKGTRVSEDDGAGDRGSGTESVRVPRRRALRRRRRENVSGGRLLTHRVLVSEEEEARLIVLAAEQNVTIPRLLIESALAGSSDLWSGRQQLIGELFGVVRLLGSLSNNVNQIARAANAGSALGADLHGTLVAVRRAASRITEAVDQLGASR